jgi:hypothetical protein
MVVLKIVSELQHNRGRSTSLVLAEANIFKTEHKPAPAELNQS